MILSLVMMLAAPALPATGATPLDATAGALNGPAVVVLWASWCASCRAELRRLPMLRAATPLPVRTLAIDPPDLARRTLVARGQPLRDAYADGRRPRAVLDTWGGPGAILPIAVALDARGRVCGRKRGLLGTDQLREWALRCSR